VPKGDSHSNNRFTYRYQEGREGGRTMRVRVVLMRVLEEEGPPEGTSTKRRRKGGRGREGGREGRTSRMMCWMRWTDSREVFFMLVTSECSAFNFLRISLIGQEEEREKGGAREGKCHVSIRFLHKSLVHVFLSTFF